MNSLRNLSLKYKIILPGIIGVIGFAIYLVVNYSAAENNSKKLGEVQEAYLPALELAGENISVLEKIKQDLVFAATTGEPSLVDEAQKLADKMKANVVEPLRQRDHHRRHRKCGGAREGSE